MASLESPMAKLNRARQQREALRLDVLALCDLKITHDIDYATGDHVYSFKSVPPLPDDLGLRIGEMLYNYRSSLDHLIWQLVLSAGKHPGGRNEFPIFNDPNEYNKNKRQKLKGVCEEVVKIVDSLQPCTSNTKCRYLWYLQKLCNFDKHCNLLLTRQVLNPVQLLGFFLNHEPKWKFYSVPVENGAKFLSIDEPCDFKPSIEIVFSNSPLPIRKDLRNIFSLIDSAVGKVFKALECYVK